MNYTLRQLEGFLAVAELGNFTRAAERMRLTQSALSVLVAELERSLRLRLLDRTTRRVELTEAGAQFRAVASKVVADLDHAVRNAHLLADRRHGRVTIAAPPLLAATMLPPVIAKHRLGFPGIELSLVDAATDRIVAGLRAGEIDLAVGTFPPDVDDMERIPLIRDQLVAACLNDYPCASDGAASWHTLSKYPVIVLTPESGIRSLAERSWLAAGAFIRPAFEVSQIATALALVEVGLGIAILPSYALRRSIPACIAVRIDPEINRNIDVVSLRLRSLSPAAASFAELLVSQLGEFEHVDSVTFRSIAAAAVQ